ncbi:hypothetical protein D7044_06785 [Micromonospora musae]|uniref:Uncharacterized protein n=1 Tax=Micromonospora musae TaxID=1894970 RepID=A0A3A9YJ02_9ACTN|nr:hypothetical protein D7044_06785 [Micromonospora musae]
MSYGADARAGHRSRRARGRRARCSRVLLRPVSEGERPALSRRRRVPAPPPSPPPEARRRAAPR